MKFILLLVCTVMTFYFVAFFAEKLPTAQAEEKPSIYRHFNNRGNFASCHPKWIRVLNENRPQ